MKSRAFKFFAAGIMVLGVVIAFWLGARKPVLSASKHTVQAAVAGNNISSSSSSTPHATTQSPVVPHKIDLPPGVNKEDSMSKVLSTLNEQPIIFYGKVVDQDDNPVPNVKVTGTAAQSEGFMGEKFDSHTTTTNSNGLFSFEGLHGMHLGLALMKEGYQYSSNNNSFTYSAMWPEKDRHKPNAGAPVIFKMWKLQGPQSLTPIGISAYIHCDGTPVSFDLETGRRVQNSGDLTVRFMRNPIQLQGANIYDWKLTVSVDNGGLIAMTDQYPNEAPADGYQSQTCHRHAQRCPNLGVSSDAILLFKN